MFQRFALSISMIALTVFTSNTLACAWQLDSSTARLTFASVKNDHIAELHRFTQLSGAWAGDNVSIRIPVSGLDTLIPIRNERMAKHLFNAEQFPHIAVSATVPPSQLSKLKLGDTIIVELPLTLEIAGQRLQLPATVQITKAGDKRLLATTVQPIMIDTKAAGLDVGIETLRTIAGLQSIDLVVPVTFSVAFTQPG
ncbi:YceI family protein [Pseudidiomarina mangrovi]|uniref:YceI family protein n=1 Tax=Pseudidiomarina mangrovi TaxID=2487133 RepID=UPI000FCAC148|nr:YceI family protein [Pseudidiomarina mangrovi]